MIDITVYTTDSPYVLAVSAQAFKVTGKGVHNREYPHRVKFFADGTIGLAAEAVVISLDPTYSTTRPTAPLAIGEQVRLVSPLGQVIGEFTVTARAAADPALIEIA